MASAVPEDYLSQVLGSIRGAGEDFNRAKQQATESARSDALNQATALQTANLKQEMADKADNLAKADMYNQKFQEMLGRVPAAQAAGQSAATLGQIDTSNAPIPSSANPNAPASNLTTGLQTEPGGGTSPLPPAAADTSAGLQQGSQELQQGQKYAGLSNVGLLNAMGGAGFLANPYIIAGAKDVYGQAEKQDTLDQQQKKDEADNAMKGENAKRFADDKLAETKLKVEELRQAALDRAQRASEGKATRDDQEQERLFQHGVQQIASIRGDPSLKNVETQRDAAISAYGSIIAAEKAGTPLNPIDYTDVIGQIYKARTGAAPTEQVLQRAMQKTIQGSKGELYTLLTGKQAPATTIDIQNTLKDMVVRMGNQADKLHDGYMEPHELFDQNLNEYDKERLSNSARGLSFSDATGLPAYSAQPAAGAGTGSGGAVTKAVGGVTYKQVPGGWEPQQ